MADLRKQFAASFFHLDHKYKVSWECAELLIELGGGPPAPPSQPNSSTLPSTQFMHPGDSISSRKSRERAITLAGDESAPPLSMSIAGPSTTSPPGEWRGSAGRNDLSQRQLWLLRDMLNRSDSSPTMLANLQTLEENPNRGWLWGEATNSTITLPSEESGRNASPTKKRRYSRLGMSGLRDMLRSLARGHQPPPVPPVPFRPGSSASTSASSSYDDQSTHQQHRPAKSSTGPDSTPSVRTSSPFSTSPGLTHKSPRRPSIASIFRFAQKSKPSPPAAESHSRPREHPRQPHAHILHSYSSGSDIASRSGNGTADGEDEEDEDWDHIDAAEDLDTAVRALGVPTRELNGAATVRGRRTKLQHRQHPHRPEVEAEHKQKASPGKRITALASTSQSSLSIWAESPSTASRSQVSLAATASPPTTSSPQPHTPPLPLPLSQVTSYLRPTRLSNVEESAEVQLDSEQSQSSTSATTRIVNGRSKSPRRPTNSRSTSAASTRRGNTLTGSVRSAPPPTPTLMPQDGIDKRGLGLSLTPETIRPLLENARKVHTMCTECVGELRTLLASKP
jgi:hypothetical protein